MKEEESVQEHIKSLTEVFEALSVVGDPVSEEDHVQLLASLPDSFNMLVTTLEANTRCARNGHCYGTNITRGAKN